MPLNKCLSKPFFLAQRLGLLESPDPERKRHSSEVLLWTIYIYKGGQEWNNLPPSLAANEANFASFTFILNLSISAKMGHGYLASILPDRLQFCD